MSGEGGWVNARCHFAARHTSHDEVRRDRRLGLADIRFPMDTRKRAVDQLESLGDVGGEGRTGRGTVG